MHMPAVFALLLVLPGTVLAKEDCKFSEPRQLDLDLAGVSAVRFDVGLHQLRVDAVAGKSGSLSGRACAATPEQLKTLPLTQKRSGNTLVVTLQEQSRQRNSYGSNYAYLQLSGSVPDSIPLQVNVGSGDAWVAGVAALTSNVGSGDLDVHGIKGAVSVTVGSGDVEIRDIGSLKSAIVGSGDLKAEQIHGDVNVGNIGSGDASIADVQGNISIDAIGSGDADISDVTGNVSVATIGSGDLDVRRIGGDLKVSSKGSGSIHRSEVKGSVQVPGRH